jgi:hypothetical protein
MPPKKKAAEAAIIKIDIPQIEAEVLQERPQLEALMKRFENYKIASQTEYVASAEELQKIKGMLKKKDDDRRFLVDPLNKHVKDINARFKPAITLLELMEGNIKRAQTDFILSERRKQEEEQRRIEEQQRKQQAEESKDVDQQICDAMAEGDTDKAQDLLSQKEHAQTFVPAPTAAMPPPIPKVAGQKVIDIWNVVVVDFAKLPDRYKIANMDALQGIADATDGKEVIEGVRFEKGVRIASSAK